MSKFKYTLPSGAKFVVDGPASATQDQSDRVFYEQVASGSLIGYTAGQILTSLATRLTTFELSRLERGTAGVDTVIAYAVNISQPPGSTQSVTTTQLTDNATTQTLLAAVQNLPVPASMPPLSDVQLIDAVDQANVALIQGDDLEPRTVGPLNPFQIKKLLAQIAKLVNQEFDQISLEKGIGRYGFTAYSLEQTGYVKPGTSGRYFSTSTANFVVVMSSPSVWTGRDGIRSLDDLLASPETQNKIQVEIMQQSYQQLTALGAIVEPPKPAVAVSTGQVYTNAGLISVGTLTGTNARNSEDIVAGFTALNLSTIGSGAVNQLAPVAGDLPKLQLDGVIQGVTSRLNGDIGSLVLNASKFGSQATALWAKAGGLSLDNIGSLTTGGLSKLGNLTGQGLNTITGSLSSGFNNISTNLTNLVPPNLNNLTGSLNVFGKAGGFATNFANPLTSLNNIGSTLQGQATAALGNLQGQATAALGNLQGQATAALANAQALAGNLANLKLPTNLFGGGGDLVSGTQIAAGFNNTVNRKTVDAAFSRILGSSKIPTPVYEYPSLPNIAERSDIIQAQNFLKNIQGQGQALLGQGQALLGQGQAIANQAQALGGRFLG
jgi:hypothetical protein